MQALLDEDDGQTQEMMAEQLEVTQKTISKRLKDMGLILKMGRWVPHELTERQQDSRKNTCEMLLSRFKRKSFLHRIVTGDEKWVYFSYPKLKRLYGPPDHKPKTTAKANLFGRKAMLCVFWDQRSMIWYELLKPDETVDGARYQRQLADLNSAKHRKRPEYADRRHKVIFLDDNPINPFHYFSGLACIFAFIKENM